MGQTNAEATSDMNGIEPKKATKAAWLALAILVVTLMFGVIDRQIVAVLAAPMGQSLGLSDVQLGAIQGLGFALFAAVAAFPFGWMADRFDRRIVLASCVLVWAASTAACGFARGFPHLMVAAIGLAAAEVGIGPIVNTTIPDLFRNREQRILANQIYFVVAFLAQSAGYILCGLILAAVPSVGPLLPSSLASLESWRLGFLLAAAPAPLIILLIASVRLNGPKSEARGRDGSPAAPHRHDGYFRTHWRGLAIIFTSIGAFFFANACAAAWLPAALGRAFGVSPAASGLMMGSAMAGGVVTGTLLSAWIVRRLSRSLGRAGPFRMGSLALAGSTVIALLFAAASSPWQAIALLCIQMAASTTIGSLVPTIMQEISPPDMRGRVSAIQTIVILPLAGFAVMAVGAMSTLVGPRPDALLIAIAVVSAPAWLLAATLMRVAERRFGRIVDALEPAAR